MKMRSFISIIILVCLVLVSVSANAATKKKKTVRNIELQTKDEMILTGTLTMPEGASVHNKVPIVILLHSLGGNRFAYTKLTEELKARKIASLALDSRGHHNSTTKLSGKKTYWQNYSNKTFEKYPADINDSVDFIKEHYVAIDTNRIGILGADVNANAAVIMASKKKNPVKSLILISPTMSFKGLSTAQPMMNYGVHPITIIVTQNDIHHYKDAKLLEKYAMGKVNFITVKSGGTGDNILKVNPNLNKTIADWFSKNL